MNFVLIDGMNVQCVCISSYSSSIYDIFIANSLVEMLKLMCVLGPEAS